MDFLQKISMYKFKIPSLVLGIFALSLLFLSSELSITHDSPRQLIAPLPFLDHMSVGYSHQIADVLWVRAIQDLDYCETQIAVNVCKNESWLYKMLDTITDLSPDFRVVYNAGALALTIMITDIDGATKIFDKGIKAFPNYWPLLYNAAYHYLYEVKDQKRAAELLLQAGQNGAPPFVFSLAGRLYSDEGRLDLAEAVLTQMIQENRDAALIQRLKDKIETMKSTMKLERSAQ